jgi:hypothetical protein
LVPSDAVAEQTAGSGATAKTQDGNASLHEGHGFSRAEDASDHETALATEVRFYVASKAEQVHHRPTTQAMPIPLSAPSTAEAYFPRLVELRKQVETSLSALQSGAG